MRALSRTERALSPRTIDDVERVAHVLARSLPLTPATRRLAALVGDPHFYNVLATMHLSGGDRSHADDWREMGRVQRAFHTAEPGFDPQTRAYSESMRLTLHAAVILHIADPSLRGSRSLYEAFLELHPTAFHENGAWFDNMRIPWSGALDVLDATPLSMLWRSPSVLAGSFTRDRAAIRAARLVKDARASV